MGLLPLEFTDCLTNSPYFRENLHAHEKELERTSQSIKVLIKEVKDLLAAAKQLSRAQRNLANTLNNFKLECIGSSQTDDEMVIDGALKEFSNLLNAIEDERDRMLEQAQAAFIDPIENFRKEYIGGAKERKKKFDKETAKFFQSQDRHLNLSTKKSGNQLQEADASLEMEQRNFSQASLGYILFLQEVQERKKTEFVETILSFMYGWLTFYHQGHEVAKDFKSFMTDLQKRLQKTRENFTATQAEAEQLMKRLLEKPLDSGSLNKMFTRQGYLYLMEKKALGTTWAKHFCQYQKENHKFTMIPYSQTTGKIAAPETYILKECIRRMSDSIDKRFCFDIIVEDKPGVLTFQALSEEDRRLWLDAMDGKEPAYSHINKQPKQEEYYLDEIGFAFVQQCIDAIEARGLDDEGLYRLVGVSSKVNKLTQMALDRRKNEKINLEDADEWEIKTITSALKTYFRNLPEPLMTFRLHSAFIAAAKLDNMDERISEIQSLAHRLPKPNFSMLEILVAHLCKVAKHSDKNLMTVSNLGVCFGPTLLRPEEETVAAIMDIKFGNIVLEILIEQYEKIFLSSSINGDTKKENINSKNSQKSTSVLHHGTISSDNHKEPVAPQRRSKRETVYVMDAGRPPGQSNHSSRSSHSGFSVSPRAESMYLDNSTSAQRVMVVQPSYVQRQSYHSMMSSSVQGHSSMTTASTQKSYSSSSSSRTTQQSSSRSQHSVSSNVSSNQQSRNVVPQRNRGKPLVVYNPSWNDHHTSSSSSSESLNSPRSSANSSHHMLTHTSPSSLKSSSSHHQPLSHGSPPVRTSSSHHQLATHSAPASASHHHHPASNQSIKTSPSQHRRMDKSSYSPAHSPNRAGSRSTEGHRGAGVAPVGVGAEKPRRSNRALDVVGHQRHGSAGSREYFVSGVRQNNVFPASPSTSSSSSSSSIPSGNSRYRTLYACVGENDSELSFEPNQIIYNVRQSREPGWLEGCLNGRTGLIPENYVEPLP
ncbi:rho GTPase-activating protein 26-like isoform X2 [Stegodyphus dumicola]|uniref:rho GTPase-activating protein 26-like isoform X2 n=1 Tax=Stegodyphus dumicola TaxID=202533 RepID=UPI0015B35946|nr:rho GTPase-activating protein 26-like isoform X2 [Stegodyphus dumicola]